MKSRLEPHPYRSGVSAEDRLLAKIESADDEVMRLTERIKESIYTVPQALTVADAHLAEQLYKFLQNKDSSAEQFSLEIGIPNNKLEDWAGRVSERNKRGFIKAWEWRTKRR